jgi:hypothetical protein
MATLTLRRLAEETPTARVRMFFKNDAGEASLVMTADKAYNPNLSGRYFPPDGTTAAELGWASPWFYAEECVGFSFA